MKRKTSPRISHLNISILYDEFDARYIVSIAETAYLNAPIAYPESTQMMLEMAYWMSIPIGPVLLWMGIKGRVMWLKAWSVGLMVLGIGILMNEHFGLLSLLGNSPDP